MSSMSSWEPCLPPSANEPVLAVDEIQGNILTAFDKLHQAVICLRLDDDPAAVPAIKSWLRGLWDRDFGYGITYTGGVMAVRQKLRERAAERGMSPRAGDRRDPNNIDDPLTSFPWDFPEINETWIQIAFSHACLARLDPSIVSGSEELRFKDYAFQNGLAKQSPLLGDPQGDLPGNPSQWCVGGLNPTRRADIFILIANDFLSEVEVVASHFHQFALRDGGRSMTVVYAEIGKLLGKSLPEHFGYRGDGASQPGIRGRLSDAPDDLLTPRRNPTERDHHGLPGQELIWPGSFVFGYVDQESSEQPGIHTQDPQAVKGAPEWARNGSYLVFRRLHQDVGTYHTFVHDQANKQKMDVEELAAKLMGRWSDGAALVRAPDLASRHPTTECTINHFRYQGASCPLPTPKPDSSNCDCDDDDPSGRGPFPPSAGDIPGDICPFIAHIRKVNPRDDLSRGNLDSQRLGAERRRLLRRSLRYGDPSSSSLASPQHDGEDRGLLFLSYQASISLQFEWHQRYMSNQEVYATTALEHPADKAKRGLDPIIGQNSRAPDRARRFPVTPSDGIPRPPLLTTEEWVIPSGGEYFFVPSRSGLLHLAT